MKRNTYENPSPYSRGDQINATSDFENDNGNLKWYISNNSS